jgi:hypothetical protein
MKSLASLVIFIAVNTQFIVLSAHASQQTSEKQENRTMNNSELSILEDIKNACHALIAPDRSTKDITTKFGAPARTPINKYDLDPFNGDLKRITLSTESLESLLVNSIELTPKTPTSISISALQKEFGDHRFPVSWILGNSFISFSFNPAGSSHSCQVIAQYTDTGRELAREEIHNIEIRKESV